MPESNSDGGTKADKLDELVELTEAAQAIADDIGKPAARAAYHLESARMEAEEAGGHSDHVLPRSKRTTP